MKSLEAQLVEALDKVAEKDPKVAAIIHESNAPLEEKLVVSSQFVAGESSPSWRQGKLEKIVLNESSRTRTVVKNNGRADNRAIQESAKPAADKTKVDEKLVKSFMALGLSEAEARFASMTDEQVRMSQYQYLFNEN
jgi:hypothetical protein